MMTIYQVQVEISLRRGWAEKPDSRGCFEESMAEIGGRVAWRESAIVTLDSAGTTREDAERGACEIVERRAESSDVAIEPGQTKALSSKPRAHPMEWRYRVSSVKPAT
jgi:hypothetical protein